MAERELKTSAGYEFRNTWLLGFLGDGCHDLFRGPARLQGKITTFPGFGP